MPGVPIVNIQSFTVPSAAYSNPTAYGDLDGVKANRRGGLERLWLCPSDGS